MPDLPVAECLPRLLAVLGAQSNAVLVAPPGAGKTTTVPLALLGAAPMDRGRILMLEPRRLAARAAASRMASLIGEPVGGTVGFRTRLESAVSSATRIEVVTTGLLIRRLLGDPGLDGVSTIILDEIHERSLEADLALALCLDAQSMLRPDLRLLATSFIGSMTDYRLTLPARLTITSLPHSRFLMDKRFGPEMFFVAAHSLFAGAEIFNAELRIESRPTLPESAHRLLAPVQYF